MRAAAWLLAAAPACAFPGPEQVHIALGRAGGEIIVSWASNASAAAGVAYGEAGGALARSAAGDSRPLNVAGQRYTHVATLTGLEAGKKYTYKVGDAKLFNFTYKRQHAAGEPERHVIFGDMGASHAFSLCQACTKGSETCDEATCGAGSARDVGLVSEVDEADMMLHLGDFAYNFDSNGGTTGDQFMRNIEQVAARVPYMVSHGNHEDGSANLAHYIERFRGMPGNAEPPTFDTAAGTGATNTLYFSWDQGLVHYVALSTEVWFGVGDAKVNRTSMLAWLEKDLAAANKNRDQVPWVVCHGHRDIYCSTGDDSDCKDQYPGTSGDAGRVRADLEPLFFKYGVDFWINGHEHSYERTYPLYQGKSDRSNVDPKATVYIVTGAAGCPEMHEGFTLKQPSWSAFRSNTFGYSVMLVHNATHIHWQQVQTDPTILFPHYGKVIDDVWFVQHRHGPFDPARAPAGTAFALGDESAERELDHWAPLLGIDAAPGQSTSGAVRAWRARHGDAAWARKEDELLRWANAHLGGGAVWEDVRGDGASDGAWFRWRHGGQQ